MSELTPALTETVVRLRPIADRAERIAKRLNSYANAWTSLHRDIADDFNAGAAAISALPALLDALEGK